VQKAEREKIMKTGSFLLGQLEKCGLSAQLATDHAEASDDSSGFRLAKIEIARSYAANDQPTIPEAKAALLWLTGEPGKIVSVGESLDLVDQVTGEVLVSGRPGAVLVDPCMVVAFRNADAFDESEPEDDLGLVAMGLAASMAAGGQPFRVATLAIRGMEVFPRRSPEFAPDKHPALLARIKAAVGRPRIACPGDWCGGCRQAPYCEAWIARAKTSLAVMEDMPMQTVKGNDGAVVEVPDLDLTSDRASAVMARIKLVRKAADLAEEQVKSFVRKGGKCVVAGKEYYPGQRDGKESIRLDDLKAFAAPDKDDPDELAAIKESLRGLIKTGQPYEQFGWRKARPAR
jgi:hypothetical protein